MTKVGGWCLLLLVGGVAVYERSRWMETPPLETAKPSHPSADLCLKDCSSTESGFTWASLHPLSDESDCDEAATSRDGSAGFAEGCKAYVWNQDPPAH